MKLCTRLHLDLYAKTKRSKIHCMICIKLTGEQVNTGTKHRTPGLLGHCELVLRAFKNFDVSLKADMLHKDVTSEQIIFPSRPVWSGAVDMAAGNSINISPVNKVSGVYRNFLLPCWIWIIFYTIIVFHDPRVCHDLESRPYIQGQGHCTHIPKINSSLPCKIWNYLTQLLSMDQGCVMTLNRGLIFKVTVHTYTQNLCPGHNFLLTCWIWILDKGPVHRGL